jgi:hypothetical protein
MKGGIATVLLKYTALIGVGVLLWWIVTLK